MYIYKKLVEPSPAFLKLLRTYESRERFDPVCSCCLPVRCITWANTAIVFVGLTGLFVKWYKPSAQETYMECYLVIEGTCTKCLLTHNTAAEIFKNILIALINLFHHQLTGKFLLLW